MNFLIRLWFLVLLLFTKSTISSAQTEIVIEGRVVDRNHQPIPFANIGIFNKGVGTLSEENGRFILSLGKTNLFDSVTFSALGFRKKTFLVSDLRGKSNLIVMDDQVTELKEVVVRAMRIKPKTAELGNKFWQGPNGVTFVDTLYAGAAMALLIEPPYQPVYPLKARLRVQKNSFGTSKIRLRLLRVNASGLPGEDFLHESIVIETKKENDWLDIDLSSYKLEINSNFFLAFEWITTYEDRKMLTRNFHNYAKAHPEEFRKVTKTINGVEITEVEHSFHEGLLFGASSHSFSLAHYSCFYRTSSLAPWQKSLYVTAARIKVSDTPQ